MAKIMHECQPEEESSNNSSAGQVPSNEDLDSDMEYSQLNDALDEISSCLDDLEQRNVALQRELYSLLESNRQMRKEFKKQDDQAQAVQAQ